MDVPRIVCITPSWLGDAVLSLPALRLLADAGARLEIVARHGTERVFADCVEPSALHTAPASRLRRLANAWGLRRRRPHAALVLAPSLSAALQALVAGAPLRVGEAVPANARLLNRTRNATREVHLSRTYRRLAALTAESLGLDVAPEPPNGDWPQLCAWPQERAAGAALLDASGCGPSPLVVAPGARYGPAKRYPAERFATAARGLAGRLGVRVALVGSAADAGDTAAVRAGVPDAVDLAGRTDLATLLGILSLASGVLSNDSGVMHLAAALGTPVVGVFGSTNPTWTRPRGPRAGWVAHPVPCSPCYGRTCPLDFACMLGLEPQLVVDALLELIDRAPARVRGASSRL